MFNEVAANFCTRCGAPLPAGARFCSACGALVGASAPGRVPTIELAGAGYELASFWRRLAAFLIDAAVFWIASWPLSAIFQVSALGKSAEPFDPENPAVFWNWMANWFDSMLAYIAVFGVIAAAAQIAMESFGWTPGKAALGMRVLREDGRRPGPVHGLARYVGKLVGGLVLYLGYLWAAWDPRRQAWHDKFAHSYVVRLPDVALGGARPAAPSGPAPLATATGPRVWAALAVCYVVGTTVGALWLAAAIPDDGTAWQRFFERLETPTPAPTPFRSRVSTPAPPSPVARLIDVRAATVRRDLDS